MHASVLNFVEHILPRLDYMYQPLFGKGARAPPLKALLLGGGGGPDMRERRKSSLHSTLFQLNYWRLCILEITSSQRTLY